MFLQKVRNFLKLQRKFDVVFRELGVTIGNEPDKNSTSYKVNCFIIKYRKVILQRV